MEITKRNKVIKAMVEHEKMTVAQFAASIGKPSANLYDIQSGKLKGVSNKLADVIIAKYPHYNKSWLLTGEGEMLTGKSAVKVNLGMLTNAIPSEEVTEVEFAGENSNAGVFFRDKNSGQLYISVPHVPFVARGEFPNLADSLEPLSEWGREVYAVDFKVNGRYISFDVRGDSMDNGMRECLQDGDKVLVRELERDNWRTLRTRDHRFWVLVFGSSVLIKEITNLDTEAGTVTCHSLNPSPEYHDFSVPLDTVRHLYYVIKIKPHEMKAI